MLRNPRRRAAKLPVLRVREGERAAFAWADFVKSNQRVFAEQLGWHVGRLLGCGFYGCVYESSDPWVVKFTRDATEGPVWAYIAELHNDPEIAHDMGGFLRPHDVARIRPDVIWDVIGDPDGPQQLPVYAIQRESATPIFQFDKYGDMYLTRRTAQELQLDQIEIEMASEGGRADMLSDDGMPMWTTVLDLLGTPGVSKNVKLRISDLAMFYTTLNDYRVDAEAYWDSWRLRNVIEKDELSDRMSAQAMRILRSAKALRRRADGSANMFGDVLGTTLFQAFDVADMVLPDLKIDNVGWRDHAHVDGTTLPLTIAVTDPGVAMTPYRPEVREIDLTVREALRRNGIDVDAHRAGLHRNPTEYESYWCTFCGGSAHPATGSVYGDRTIACRRCEQELWEWAQRHTQKRKYRKSRGAWEPSFYEAAAKTHQPNAQKLTEAQQRLMGWTLRQGGLWHDPSRTLGRGSQRVADGLINRGLLRRVKVAHRDSQGWTSMRDAYEMTAEGREAYDATTGVLEPNDAPLEFTNVSAKTFYEAFEGAMGPQNPYSAYVSHYSIPELQDMRARYLSSSGLSGIAVKDHGDGRIEGTALFNEGDPRGSGSAMLQHAIDHAGVNYLECFGEGLRDLYERNGFVVVDMFPFNDEYAPSNWNYKLFGRPDYFTMKLRRQPMDKIPETADERRAAVSEMIKNPDAARARIIESLRSKGLSDAEVRREVAIIEATVGF